MCHLTAALPSDLAHGLSRLRGRYDTAIATPELLTAYSTANPRTPADGTGALRGSS